MAVRQRRYSKEELVRRGKEIYETQIRQQVESDYGRIVVIDIETVKIVGWVETIVETQHLPSLSG
jgi:Fe-S cluster biogenesis protein NfuA